MRISYIAKLTSFPLSKAPWLFYQLLLFVYNLFVHWNLPCQNNAGDKNQLSGREATFLNTNQPHRSQPKPPTPAALRTEP